MAKYTSKMIDDNIKTFTTNRDTLRQLAHDTAMMILYHAAPKTVIEGETSGSGDTTRALKLIKAMPKSWAEQMNQWFNTFSPIRVVHQRDAHGLCTKYKALDKSEKDQHWKLSEAMETPFWELTEEKDVVLIDNAKVTGWHAAQAKAWQKKLDDGKIDPKAIASTKALIAALNAIKLVIVEEAPANDATAPVEQPALPAPLAAVA